LHTAKNLKVIQAFSFNLKYFDMFLKNTWILQQVCKISKDFGLHFKTTINIIFFLLICEIINLYIRRVFYIEIKKKLFLLTYRIMNLYVRHIPDTK